MENKICPLSIMSPAECPFMNCKKNECAWWDEDSQACALLTLARSVRKVTRNGG